MSEKLLVWKWSEAYDSPDKRVKKKMKIARIASDFARKGTHPAIGTGEFEKFLRNILQVFGPTPTDMPFKIERCNECLIFKFSNGNGENLVPAIRNISQDFGLNTAEYK